MPRVGGPVHGVDLGEVAAQCAPRAQLDARDGLHRLARRAQRRVRHRLPRLLHRHTAHRTSTSLCIAHLLWRPTGNACDSLAPQRNRTVDRECNRRGGRTRIWFLSCSASCRSWSNSDMARAERWSRQAKAKLLGCVYSISALRTAAALEC